MTDIDGRRLRVVIADDHAPTRAGVRMALEADGFQVVGEASNATAAVALAREHQPDVCVLDVHIPGGGGISAARGFLLKDMDPDRLGASLRGILIGEAGLPPAEP